MSRSQRRRPRQANQNGRQVKTAIEAVLNLCEIALAVLVKVKRMVGAAEGRFEVAQQRVDGVELLKFDAGSAAASDGTLVTGTDRGDAREAGQPIGDHLGRGAQRFPGPLRQGLLGEDQLFQANQHGMTGLCGLHRRNEGDLVFRTPPAFTAGQRATKIGVVNFHTPIELPALFALGHDLQQLVLHQPGAFVAHAQVALELQRRDAVLGLRQQVHGQKPARQGQFGGLKDCPACHRGLLAAGRTLPILQALALKRAVVRAGTVRADKARRPARGHQRRMALRLRAVALHEVR